MDKPINRAICRLLDQVDWKPIKGEINNPMGLPIATHEGILSMLGYQLKVYQLDTGQRVIEEASLINFFEEASDEG